MQNVALQPDLTSSFETTRSGVHKLFAIAGGITFIFMNYGRSEFKLFCLCYVASILLPHTDPSLLRQVFLAVFLLSILI